MDIIMKAKLTCPVCGTTQEAEMPVNACQHFFVCAGCKSVLKPKEGDCCVFCSYSDVKCPPKQMEQAGR
jgi:hypothetical protein